MGGRASAAQDGGRPSPVERLAERGGGVEALRFPAVLFGIAARVRRALYDRGLLNISKLDVPVVSVGNLTAGGTGKTPMVAWIARLFEARGLKPGLLARGYGKGDAELNDEGRLLAQLLPGVLQVQNKDRIAGGLELMRMGADAIVLDDGFQHRRLHRDVDIVLVDATRPWGLAAPRDGGEPVRAMLPRGLLRERPAALARANAVVLTRADDAGRERCDALADELLDSAPGLPIARACHRPSGLVRLDGKGALALEDLAGRDVDLISAIGNPAAFENTIRGMGATVGQHRRFADHHHYRASDLDGLGSRPVVTTGKDAVKLAMLDGVRAEILVLEIELEVQSGALVLEALIDALPLAQHLEARAAIHAGTHG